MEPYIIAAQIVVLICVIAMGAIALRLERENRHLRIKCIILDEIAKSLFDVGGRLINLHDDLDRNNRYELNDESTSTLENFER
jgi:hypothetical protein